MRGRDIPRDLIRKYDIAGPRYTSYPTVPAWKGLSSTDAWLASVAQAVRSTEMPSLSLYIHVPFCDALCTFCGCNKKITKDRSLGPQLIQAIHREFEWYKKAIPQGTRLKELHFGGGTPTWLTATELEALTAPLVDDWFQLDPAVTLSMEIDPRVTTEEHCDWLARRGFNRISLGVQDFDHAVMEAVNRIQPLDVVERSIRWLHERGIEHVNFDLIYGLPFQTLETVRATMKEVIRMRPSRIAYYAYAHVPWIRPAQKILERDPLPTGEAKRALYELGREMLEDAGYVEIGMDHFALPTDEMVIALERGGLHRNFMGYTVQKTPLLLGLGPSSISDSWTMFAQNEKDTAKYFALVESGMLPIVSGHDLTEEDLFRRRLILDLMCRMEASAPWASSHSPTHDMFAEFARDGLVEIDAEKIRVTALGRAFVRNICMAADAHLQRTLKDKPQLYSRTV